MLVTCLKAAICLGALLVAAKPALSQVYASSANRLAESVKAEEAPVVEVIQFTGLRHIAPTAVAAQISSHPGDRFDAKRLEGDIRALARLGWFESIQVEATSSTASLPQLPDNSKHVTLIFHLKELPFSFQSGVLGLPAALAETDRKNVRREKARAAARETSRSGGASSDRPCDSRGAE
jgi:outer membrane protein assembly factor BamA